MVNKNNQVIILILLLIIAFTSICLVFAGFFIAGQSFDHLNQMIDKEHEIENIEKNPIVAMVNKTEYIEVEVPVEVEKIVEVPVDVLVSKTLKIKLSSGIYEITELERLLLIQLVYRECGSSTDECMVAVASVVLNRLDRGYWGSSIFSVITAKNQFAPCGGLDDRNEAAKALFTKFPASDSSKERWRRCATAVDYVLSRGPQLPSYVMYFRSDCPTFPGEYNLYKKIGSEYFGYFIKDKR